MRELRDARAEDVPLLARVLEMAGRGHLPRGPWDLLFPEPRERGRALERLAGHEPSWCHRSVFHVATWDGEPAAALCAFAPGGLDLGKPLAEVFAHLGWPAERIAGAGPLLAPYLRCFPDLPADAWIVENVGALPAFRRRGLVAALLERALDEGCRRGHRRAQISCLLGNEPARRAYEGAGFRIAETREDPEFAARFGAPGFARLVLSL
ncbi:MAG TPA: GNAT family N-acetyltransferase [Myxococcota bacterium]|nr:GNAT family N-acetyltransferase [Myxococcota bacterium]